MTLKEFQLTLKNELIRRGIPESIAEEKTLTLVKTFSEEDLKEIDSYTSPSDFADISESLIEIIMTAESDDPKMKAGTIEFQMPYTEDETPIDLTKTMTAEVPVQDETEPRDEVMVEKPKLNGRSRARFILLSVLTSPAWLTVAALIVILFGLVFLSVFSIIAFLIIMAIVLVCGGVILLLAGVVYGVSLITGGTLGTGLFEMGIGFACLGAGIALAVLSYNLAVRAMPYIVRHVASFWKYLWHNISLFIIRIKERCNNR